VIHSSKAVWHVSRLTDLENGKVTLAAVETRTIEARTTQPGGCRVWASDRDHVIVSCDRFFTMIWQRETRLDAVNSANRFVTQFAESLWPARFCLLTLVEADAPLPTSGARAGLAHMLRANADYLVSSAVSFEGSGFRAAAVRGVATGIAVMSNHQFPHRVFARVDEAADWLVRALSDELGQRQDERQLLQTVNRLRQAPRKV
jgi:hypothetical protein